MNTNRLNDIVNPYPERYADNTGFDGSGGRSGITYDYDNERNKWVIEGIHDSFINYGAFPEIGTVINSGGPITDNDNSITLEDAMAYTAIYPQNATVIKLEQPKNLSEAITQFDFSPLSRASMITELQQVYQFVTQSPSANSLLTVSELALYKEDSEELNYLRLPAIKYQSSQNRTIKIRKSFGLNPTEATLGKNIEEADDIENKIQTKQRDGLDFVDWTKNLRPSQSPSVVYYNARDGFIYYLSRTRSRSANSYDAKFSNDGNYLGRKRTFLKKATSKMLAFMEIDYVPQEDRREFVSRLEFLTKYGDRDRPPAPDGVSVWLLGARVQLADIQSLKDIATTTTPPPEVQINEGNQKGKGGKQAKTKNKNRNNQVNTVPYESYLSPYQISKKLISNNSVNRGVVYQIKNMLPALVQTEKVISNYSDAISNARVTPSMISGFNIRNQLENFRLTNQSVQKFISLNALPNETYDMIEFRMSPEFEIRYAFYNGSLILDGLGLSKKNLIKDNSSENAFKELTNTSVGYFYYSTELSTFEGRKDIPPWTTFLTQYTYPNLNANSFFKSKIANTTNQGSSTSLKDISKLMDDGDRKKSSSQKMAKASGDTKLFPSEKDLRTIRAKKDFISSKELHNAVRSAVGSCDTGLSSALSEAFQIYDLVSNRADKKALIAGILVKSKDAILFLQKKYAFEVLENPEKILSGESVFEFGKLRISADNVESYINRPDFLLQEIEREIYRQVSCIFDLIGDGVNELILDPLIDEPGPLKTLVRDVVSETNRSSKAYTVDFLRYKITTRDSQKGWRLAVEKIIESFLKQMILDIFKDVVTALLGCGPEQSEDKETENKNKLLESYGELRLNLLIENAESQVKLLEICENLDIKNTTLTGDNLDQVTISPVTEEQLYQLHEDISDTCTKSEVEGLLEGNAPRDLVVDLVDMTNDNIDIGEYNNFLTAEQKEILIQSSVENNFDYADPSSVIFTRLAKNAGIRFTEDRKALGITETAKIRLKMSAESFRSGDIRYATLDFDENKLREYFKELGKALGPDSLPSSPLVPEDAFCDPKLLAARGLEGVGVSLEQLNLEVQQGTQAELTKLLDLCELFNGAFDGFDLKFFNKWEEGLPIAEGYRAILEKIAFLSRLFQAFISDALSMSAEAADAPLERQRTSVRDTQLWSTITTNFGTQRIIPKVRMVPNPTDREKDDVFQWYISAGVDQTFVVNFQIRGNTVFLAGQRPSDSPEDEEEFMTESLGSFELNRNNGMGINKGTLHNYIKEDGLLFRAYSAALDNYNNEIATSINALVENTVIRSRTIEGGFPLAIANPNKIAEIVTSFYITNSDRLRPLTQAISEPLFATNGDPCVLTQQERIAIACLNSIQTRISNFILNSGVLFPALGWGMGVPDIIDMISGYLAKKFEYEMTDKKMFDIYLKSMDDVDKAFSKGPANAAGVLFDISTTNDLREKFKLAIKFSVQSMFFNISKQSFENPGRNPYENQATDNRGTTLLNYLRTGEVLPEGRDQVANYNPSNSLAGFTDGEFNRPAVAPTVAALQQAGGFDGSAELTWTQQYGYYYMPISLLNALTMIYYDYAVKPQQRLPNFKFFAEKRVANADDTLLTAINPENVSAFSERFSGYPLTVAGETYYSDEEVMKAIKLYERQFGTYERYLNVLKTPLYSGGDGSYDFLSYKHGEVSYTILGNTPQENEFRTLQLGALEFNSPTFTDNSENDGRDFFNPLYSMYVPIFKRLPAEEQDFWIKEALKYNYSDASLVSYIPLGDEMGTAEQRANPNTQKAFAFYERKRVLEIATPPNGDYTFMRLYKRAYSTFLNHNPYAPVGERTSDGKAKIKAWVSKERTEALARNTSSNDELSGVINSYGSQERNNFDMINYPQPGQWGIRRGSLY